MSIVYGKPVYSLGMGLTDFNLTFGEWLIERYQEQAKERGWGKWSDERFGDMIEVSGTTVGNRIKAKHRPRIGHVMAIAKVLNLDLDEVKFHAGAVGCSRTGQDARLILTGSGMR